jgi:hypothetical protein
MRLAMIAMHARKAMHAVRKMIAARSSRKQTKPSVKLIS